MSASLVRRIGAAGASPGRAPRPWAALGIAALVAIAACAAGPDDDDAPVPDTIAVRLDGEGQTWRASLVLATGDDGTTTLIPLGREVHAPLGATVKFALASRDYICDFALPELGARDFAAPDLPGQLQVRPDHAGRYELRGDEMCGLPHGDQALGVLVVETPAAWRAWLKARVRAASRGGAR